MTIAVVAGAVGGLAAMVALWAWAMDRLDEREERRHADEMRRRDPYVPGSGGPRHLRSMDRRW